MRYGHQLRDSRERLALSSDAGGLSGVVVSGLVS